MRKLSDFSRTLIACFVLAVAGATASAQGIVPAPLLKQGEPVRWWFVFKLNSRFPGCDGDDNRVCLFGGDVNHHYARWGQQFVYSSDTVRTLTKGSGCAGDSVSDPVGATFGEIYNGTLHYVVWNDQFKGDPELGCGTDCGAPWGHSKGILAWDDNGDGLVMQVSTPSWPGAGSAQHPRQHDGNTLGCVEDNNVMVSQHFFALQLDRADVKSVLQALANASVATASASDTEEPDPQVVSNGGPADIQQLVAGLGRLSASKTPTKVNLSSGVILISKPSKLHVPPWQMVSSLLGGKPLQVASWWMKPAIMSTTASTRMACWDAVLTRKPGAVQIATSGAWDGTGFTLTGGPSPDRNHAKIGVSTAPRSSYAIFGDMNQQGSATDRRKCASSQNARGGLFYVIADATLKRSVAKLIGGLSAPTR